ncbi:MAG: tetratricopeptide repeat protein [Polyangiaceae bacterium]
MNSRTLAVALLLALPLVSLPHVAAAQPAVDDSLVKEARARFKEGVDLYDKGQYEAARAKFLQAYALRRHPSILLNMGLSSLRSNHPAEAARYLTQFQREATSATPQEHADADKAITEARTKDARLDVSAPPGTEISVDDTVIGNAPLSDSVDVDPGQHTIKGKASDGTVDSRTVNTSVGQRLPVKFGPGSSAVVAPIPPPVPTTNPETPPPDTTTPPPTTTQPPPQQAQPPGKKFNPLAPPKTLFPVFIGAGVAGAGVVTAVLFGVFRGQAVDSMNSATAEIRAGGGGTGVCASQSTADKNKFGAACSALQQDIDHANTDTTVANIGIGVAVVGVVGAAAWYLFSPKKDDAPADSSAPVSAPTPPPTAKIDVVAPWMGWGSGGLSVRGSF